MIDCYANQGFVPPKDQKNENVKHFVRHETKLKSEDDVKNCVVSTRWGHW